MTLAGAAFAGSVPIGATTSSAESAAYPHESPNDHRGPCEKDKAKCQADAAKFDQWCSGNADKCNALKAWAEKRREYCEANAQKCEEMKEKMQERHDEMCQQDPSKPHCHAIKANNQPNDNEDEGGQEPPPPSA
jgi:hypothetical protein